MGVLSGPAAPLSVLDDAISTVERGHLAKGTKATEQQQTELGYANVL